MKLGVLAAAVVVAAAGDSLAGTVTYYPGSQYGTAPIQQVGLSAYNARSRIDGNAGTWDMGVGPNPTPVANWNTLAGVTASPTFTGSFLLDYSSTNNTITYKMFTGAGQTGTEYSVSIALDADGSRNSFTGIQVVADSLGNTSNPNVARLSNVSLTGMTLSNPTSLDLNPTNARANYFLYSASQLEYTDFTIRGDLTLTRNGGTNSERPSLNFYLDQYGALQVVPLPPAAWAGLGSLACVAGFGVIRRRRNAVV